MFELLQDVWSRDKSSYPATSPTWGWIGLCLRIKCSICILLGRRGSFEQSWDCSAPVYVSPIWVDYAAPSANWQEIAVDVPWRKWRYYTYTNGT
jgi:hypothetical protein